MPDDKTTKEKMMPVSVVAALVASLAGNGYMGYKADDSSTAAAESSDKVTSALERVSAIEKRFEDHLSSDRSFQTTVNDGIGSVRTEISGVKSALINLVSSLSK